MTGLILTAAGGWYWYYVHTPEYRARQLLAELRLMERPSEEIVRDFVAIGRPAVPVLIEALGDEDWAMVALPAEEALEMIGSGAVPFLIDGLKHENRLVRKRAALTLGEIGPSAEEAVPALAEALEDRDHEVRYAAAHALGDIGTDAKQAVPALLRSLKDGNRIVHCHTALALSKIGRTDSALAHLSRAMKDEDGETRAYATAVVGMIGPPAAPLVPDLIRALKARDASLRRLAAKALGKVGSPAKQAVPDLIRTLQDKDTGTRGNAARALGQIGPAAESAIPALVEACKDEDSAVWVRDAAAQALQRIRAGRRKDSRAGN